MTAMATEATDRAIFPTFDATELDMLRPHACAEDRADGEVLFRAGDADIDFFVVECGSVDIFNPVDNHRLVVTHRDGQFIGDIDLLTRRPVVVEAVCKGPVRLMRVTGKKLRELLNTIPRLSEKIVNAFTARRARLMETGVSVGLRVTGPGSCKDTNLVREFLYKNFVPFVWYDSDEPEGKERMATLGNPKKSPVIECGDGTLLLNPKLRDLARCAGIWRDCPDESFDLAVVGGGPAGMTAAVYAASEGLSTIVLDRLGPGGQAGGSSRIENFIGFPSGISGADLATRGVLQMLKFGAIMNAPIAVDRLEPAATEEDCHILHLDCGAKLKAHTVLVATGAKWRKLEAKNAEKYDRAGIYYACTSVEGYLYQDKDVAVVGAGNSAGQAAMFLAERCAKCVHMLIRGPELGPGMSSYLADRIKATKNIHVHVNTEITEVHGDKRINGLTLIDKAKNETSELNAAAVFVFIGAEPHSAWLPASVAKDKNGYILTGAELKLSGQWPLKDRDPCPLETSLPRVLAGGDVRAGSTKRVGFAVGDGALAVTCAHRLRANIK